MKKVFLIDSIMGHLSWLFSAGVFCAIVSHPADSVVSVLNKEKGSSASEVLKRLGFRGKICFLPSKERVTLGSIFFTYTSYFIQVYGRDSLPVSSWSALWLHYSGLSMTLWRSTSGSLALLHLRCQNLWRKSLGTLNR